MAIITALPSRQVIDGFKGTIDFYLWRGIPCVRKWPIWRKRKAHPAELANQQQFAAIQRAWKYVDGTSRQAFQDMAAGTGLTARDVYTRAAVKGLYRYPTVPLPPP